MSAAEDVFYFAAVMRLRRTPQSLRWARDVNCDGRVREFASKGGAGRANELQLACQLFASFELLKDVKNL